MLSRLPRPPEYLVGKAAAAAQAGYGNSTWNSRPWRAVPALQINHFRPESSSHRPRTEARLLYDDDGILGIFRVHDQYVLCQRTNYGDEVWKDSCVEFFLKPRENRGYFNFEFNCGGAFLCSYITNPQRTPAGFKEFTRIPANQAAQVKVSPSLCGKTAPELATPIVWTLAFFIPFPLLEKYAGPIGNPSGQIWRANFYKCAEENSHPHWAAWSPVDELNFHLPRCFGRIRFE